MDTLGENGLCNYRGANKEPAFSVKLYEVLVFTVKVLLNKPFMPSMNIKNPNLHIRNQETTYSQ
jgi:hypothetical protein